MNTEYCPDGTKLDPSIGCLNSPTGLVDANTDLLTMITKIGNYFVMFAVSLSVIMIILAALQYTTAMGDNEKIDQAKRNVKWALIGLVIALTAYLIVNFVVSKLF